MATTYLVSLLYQVGTSASDYAHLCILGNMSHELAMASWTRLTDSAQVIFFRNPNIQGSCSKEGTLTFLCRSNYTPETFCISPHRETGISPKLCYHCLLNLINASTERIKVDWTKKERRKKWRKDRKKGRKEGRVNTTNKLLQIPKPQCQNKSSMKNQDSMSPTTH